MSIPENISLTAVMDTVLDAVIIIDPQGTIQAFNPSATRMFGYSLQEVMGKNVKMLMPEPYHSSHDTYLSDYLKSREPKVIGIGREVQGRRKNGEVFPMDLGVNEMLIEKKSMFVGTIRDITERKHLENSLKNSIKKLEEGNQELERINQELNDFAYIASHDLKSPLRGIGNHADFLKEDCQDRLEDEDKKRIDRIVFLARSLEKLIDNLLSFSRIGKQLLSVKEVPMMDLIQEVAQIVKSSFPEETIEIKIHPKFPKIFCDKGLMTEVFLNLLTNGIKYNKKTPKEIEIGYTEEGAFFVKDNGVGIETHFYKEIFRIFKRLNDEDEKIKGSGVGLTFVKKIIERHKGRIWLESVVGEGTTFYFTLPQERFKHGIA